ncbi:hypothetical protein DBV05_g7996 [Lasiodiplodia theobromae]|uniref:Uncharacterized protein n=1 Tax=Lasiodiplodia theobromae TaxID=45133 RepID=A0A5N5D6S2_9PEZI|nr:hypothetical protein DBV05_g7996 [Lasiodiplodia theobromae]
MSPRKLKFGSRSVQFECYGRQFVERAQGRGIPGTDVLQNHLWVQFMDKRGNARDIIGRYWTGSQYQVSHRSFTNPTDRLPAISSFAEFVAKKIDDVKKIKKTEDVNETEDHKEIGDDYIVGLFRPDLHRGLTWNKKKENKVNGFQDHVQKSFFGLGKHYVAPSWSWISTPSSTYSWHASTVATITEADCDIKAEIQLEREDNPFGRVKSGHIVLTSKAYHSESMQLYMQEEKLKLKDNAGFEADVDLDWALQLGPDEDLLISDCHWDETHPLWKSQGPLSGMHLVPLIQEEDGSETIGLIIVPFPNQKDEFYMRAGIFTSKGTWNLSEDCPRKSLRVF